MAKVDLSQLDDKAIKDLANLALELSHDKDTRPIVARTLKNKFGKTLMDVEVQDLRAEMKAEREREKQEREAEKIRGRLEAQRAALKDRYDDAAISDIEKIMEKEGISNYETAAKLYAADLKPAEPTPDIRSGVFEMPKFDIKNINNLRKDSISRANQVVGELMQRRAKR